MAVINRTDDSFYSVSCCSTTDDVLCRVDRALTEGADILDIGGCSTRPQSHPVSVETEWRHISESLTVIRKHFPTAILSIDTFRSEIAQKALNEFGGLIINDVSGLADETMACIAANAGVPYVLTHSLPLMADTDIFVQMIDFFVKKINALHQNGVKDIIIDPGFGFNKTTEQNWQILSGLDSFQMLDKPMLIGVSRKRMLQNLFGCTAEDALNATTTANMQALMAGAKIIRVHDVKEAKQAVRIYLQCNTDKRYGISNRF